MSGIIRKLGRDASFELSDRFGWWVCLALAALALLVASTLSLQADPRRASALEPEATPASHTGAPDPGDPWAVGMLPVAAAATPSKGIAVLTRSPRPQIWSSATISLFIDDNPLGSSSFSARRASLVEPHSLAGRRLGRVNRMGPSISGLSTIPSASAVLERMADPVFASPAHWNAPRAPAPQWRRAIARARGLDRASAAASINDDVNARIIYLSDEILHGVPDLWSSAAETMRRGAGDCEDLAILKMWLLARAGVPLGDMYVLVVRSTRLLTAHAVLLVASDEGLLVLDNLAQEVRPLASTSTYEPIFSVNTEGLWLHVRPIAAR